MQIVNNLLKNVLVGGGTTETDLIEAGLLPTCIPEGSINFDISEPLTENLGGRGSNNLLVAVVASCNQPFAGEGVSPK